MAATTSFLTTLFITLLILLSVIAAIIMVFVVAGKFRFKKKLTTHQKNPGKAFLFVKIPPSNEQKENAMDEFLHSLHRVMPTGTHISLEMVSTHQFLRFYIVVPKTYKNVIESQLYAQYPEAEIEDAQDYLLEENRNTAYAQLGFKHHSMNPINTYRGNEEGFLKNLSAVLSKTDPNDTVVVQIALKRINSRFWSRGIGSTYYKSFGKRYDGENKPYPAQEKLSQDLYTGKLRIAYSSSDKVSAQQKLHTILGLFKTTKSSYNELKQGRFSLTGDLDKAFKARLFEKGDLWSATELATLYYFPYRGTSVSNVVNTTSKRAPAPDILPTEGMVDPKEVSFIGETNFRNEGKKFGIKRLDRRRHLYVVGKTGSGKSRLLELLLISDLQNGEGCCILDPHGDLADELLMFVPKERIKDVVYINPTDRDFPIGFNPLEPVTDYQMRQHLSTFFIAIFKKLLAFNWNARMEHLMRYITLALLETPDSNVLGIQRILSDTTFRQRVIKQIQDPVVKSFWLNDFSASNQQFMNEAVIPILNKVGQFTSNPIVRNMIGQRKNMLDFEEFMNSGKIVIINLSKGKLGDENTALLGSMFITKIQQAALSRSKMPEEQRKDFYFYVDEFQNFATDAFSSILSEARKYHLDLTMAHQYIAQLPDDVKATAFGNVGSIITFAVGGDDAAYLQKEFSPTFSADDMINLNVREMYIKMSVDGKLTTPFSARTLSVPRPTFDYSREIVDHSRMTYGKNRVAVENEIAKWSSSTESVTVDEGGEELFPEPII